MRAGSGSAGGGSDAGGFDVESGELLLGGGGGAAAAGGNGKPGAVSWAEHREVLVPVLVACAGGSMLFGYHLGVINAPLEYMASDLGLAGDAIRKGWVVSSVLVGATAGSQVGGRVADALGQRTALLLNAPVLVVGALMCAGASSLGAMLAGRLVCGIGAGVASAVVPVYISEVAPVNVRGTLGSWNQVFICVGLALALLAGVPLSPANASTWWRVMFALAALPAVATAGAMASGICPESPSWLAARGRTAEAEAAARKLWGVGLSASQAAGGGDGGGRAGDGDGPAGGAESLFGDRYRGMASIPVMLFVCQQFSGINAIMYFSSKVFRDAGVQQDVLAALFVMLVNVGGTVLTGGLIESQGRKRLLTLSYVGQAGFMLLLAAVLGISEGAALSFLVGPLAVAGTVGYVFAFACGVGPIPSLLCAELFPSALKARAVALGMLSHWACNFLVGLCFLGAVGRYGVSAVYLFFAAVSAASAAYTHFNLVETKGRSPEEIERLYKRTLLAQNSW